MGRFHLVSAVIVALMATLPLKASDIEGQVRSTVRSVPLKSAVIQLRAQSLILADILADSPGRFEFHNLTIGSYVVRVDSEGFADRDETVLIMRNNSREFVLVELLPAEKPQPNTQEQTQEVVSVHELKVPDAARREYENGLKEGKKGGCSKAVPHFEKAIAAFENYADALNEIGKCFQGASMFERAEDSFRKAIQYGSSIFSYINLADVLVSRKQFEESQKVLHEGIAKFPSEGDLYFALANSLFGQGHMKEAEEAALAAHSKFHASADVHLLLAKIYVNRGKYPEVATQFKTYLVENPRGPMADRVRQNLKQLERK